MKKLLIILLVISLVLSIYLTSVKSVIYDDDFYKKEFAKHDIYDDVYNADEISEKLIGFFEDKNDLPLAFNENEKSHLMDVKILIKRGNIFLSFLLLFNIVLLSFLLYDLKKILIYSGVFGMVLPLPFIMFNFTDLFTKFHLLFFPQGNWVFPIDSLLIMLFPQQFFYDSLIRILIISVVFLSILIILGFLSSRFSSN